MKRHNLTALGLAALAVLPASCQLEERGANVTGEVDFTLNAGIPAELTTYADGNPAFSHRGGAGNVNAETYDLRYTLEVYDGNQLAYEAVQVVDKDFTTRPVQFKARLLAKQYRFVLWADFVREIPDNGTPSDLYYNTENLRAISYTQTVKDSPAMLLDDAADAYYKALDVNLTEAGQSITNVKLQRPFGKMRFIATDELTNPTGQTERPAKVTLNFGGSKVPTTFNADAGVVGTENLLALETLEFTAKQEDALVNNQPDTKEGAYLLGYAYFFPTVPESAYPVKVTVYGDEDKQSQIGYRDLSGIPVQPNKLTTVIGNFYSNEGGIEVKVDDMFGGENGYDTETAITRSFDEINQALAAGKEKILFEGMISGQNENEIIIPANAPEEFSIDFGSKAEGFSPTVVIKGTDGDETPREIRLISQTPTNKLGLDIQTVNTTYTLDGRYSGVKNNKATSLVKTMGYIMKLTLIDGDAEIYANIGTGIEFKGSGIIKYALADNGKELGTYGKFAAERKCEKIGIDADFTYVNGMYIAGEIDLNGHTITMNPKPEYNTNPFFVSNNLVMKNGFIKSECPDASYSLFQIQEGVSVSLQNITIECNANIMAALNDGTSISLENCNIDSKYSVISTNASSPVPTVDIKVEKCTLNGGSTILKNVPGKLEVNESRISGNIHGIIVRGGNAVISNSTVSLNYNNADYASDLNAYKDCDWGQGDQLPLAAMTIGNRNASAYQYPTNVTLRNTELKLEGSTGSHFPTLYAYANPDPGLGVTLIYDEDCRFDKNPECASGNITVSGGSKWTGSSAEPVIDEATRTVTVNSADQLAGLAQMANSGSRDIAGYTITLNADIDLADLPWTPIGNGNRSDTGNTPYFSGTFDGNGHTIRNINAVDERGDKYGAGLFSIVKDGTVKNVTIEGGYVEAVDFAAAVAGIVLGESTIENCHVKGVRIKSSDVAAGIVARIYGTNVTVIDCTNASDIEAAGKAGGIAGIASNNCTTVIEGCTNSGSVKAPAAGSGGILGYAGPAENRIANCTNTGSIGSETDKYAGGIVGYQASTDPDGGLVIDRCINRGTVTGINAGGLYGIPGASQPVTITNSENNGPVKGKDSAGGIAARAGSGKIENCTNTATVTAAPDNKAVAGGIAGNLGEAQIINCKGGDAAAVITAQYAGRLVGHIANKPHSPEDVLASLTIDDSNGDCYEGYRTIGAMGLYTAWSNINIVSGTLHGKPLIEGQASGYIKIHEGAHWDAYPGETGTWKCAPTDDNNWTKL